jgi:hypothetical protein
MSVSAMRSASIIAFSNAALARRRAERRRWPREQFHRRRGLHGQRTALLQGRHARPQHDDSGGNAPAYAEGFHKIENGPPWLILCNRVAVARVISRSEPKKTGPPLARRPPSPCSTVQATKHFLGWQNDVLALPLIDNLSWRPLYQSQIGFLRTRGWSPCKASRSGMYQWG